MARSNTNMLEGSLAKNILLYTIPIILTSVLQLLFNAADLVVVGRFCGSISVAAVGSTGSITGLLVNFFIGLSVGAGVCAAHGLGSRDYEDVHRLIHSALPLAAACGLFMSVLGVTMTKTFLRMMGAPETVLPLSALYMQIFFLGAPFNLVYNYSTAILRALGDTKSPLIYLSISGVLNVLMNLVFVIFLDMNVAGVALATILAQALSAILVVRALLLRRDAGRLELKKLRFHKKQLAKMLRIGFPAAIQSSLFSISNVMIQSSINSFGDVFMSGSAAAGNIENFLYASMNAFSQTALNFTGQNMGAKQYHRVKRIFATCLAYVAGCGLLLGLLTNLFGRQLLSIYITDSPEAIAYGVTRLLLICLPYFVCGMMDVSTGALRGLGESFPPMVISVLGICGFRILWIHTVFRWYHTAECLYLSYLVSWIITFACQRTAFAFAFKKHTRE